MKHMTKAAVLLSLVTPFISARDPECRTMQVNLGPLVNYADYKFDCTSKLQGALVGLHFDWEHSRPKREFVLVRFDGRWSAGKEKGCNIQDRIQDYRPELDFGWNFNPCWCGRRSVITPFFGLGFIYEQNKIGAESSSCPFSGCASSCSNSCSNSCSDSCSSSSDSNSIRYYNIYVPVGLRVDWKHSECFQWGLNVEYRIDAWTRLQVGEDCNTLCNKVKPHHRTQGVLLEVPFQWNFREGECVDWHVRLVPFFDYNKFGSANCECGCSSTCSNSCSDSCSSSSSCCSQNVLGVLENCDPEVTSGCEIPSLRQYYAGARLDLGVRF